MNEKRVTELIRELLMDAVNAEGVGVVMECRHLCMMMRGVEKQNSRTVTSSVRGLFRRDAKTRDEFLRLVYGGVGL